MTYLDKTHTPGGSRLGTDYRTSMTRFRYSSTVMREPGVTRGVVKGSSMMAGRGTTWPGGRREGRLRHGADGIDPDRADLAPRFGVAGPCPVQLLVLLLEHLLELYHLQ